ncbi:MAG: hypothetical protein KDA57_15505 [Planctomycetales bacterium]|nr:hypothetical protein [Planctomycetales bacterium]
MKSTPIGLAHTRLLFSYCLGFAVFFCFLSAPVQAIVIDDFHAAGLHLEHDGATPGPVLTIIGHNFGYSSMNEYSLNFITPLTNPIEFAQVSLVETSEVHPVGGARLQWSGGQVEFRVKVVNDTPVDLTDNGASSWLNFSGAVSNLPDGAVLGDMSFGISNPAALAGFGVWTSPATNCLALTDANVMVSEGGPSLLTDGFSADVLDFYKNFVGTIEMVFTSSLDEGDIVFSSFFTGGAVPEPTGASLILGAAAAADLLLRRRNRKRG